MPSPTTALDIIQGALGLTNAVASDQILTNDEVSDSLSVFNDLIEDWNTQNLAVYGQANQTFNTVAGQATYTIGTGGNWAAERPERINDPAYSVVNGASQPCLSMTQAEYNLITVKTQQQPFPYRYLYVNEYPLGLITLWPIPSGVIPITFSMDRIMTQISSANAAISFPMGYAKAFKYALGVELSPFFGKRMTDYPDVMKIAMQTFANIKRANKKLTLLSYPSTLVRNNPNYPDFLAGRY
jgi:hypothetical protein